MAGIYAPAPPIITSACKHAGKHNKTSSCVGIARRGMHTRRKNWRSADVGNPKLQTVRADLAQSKHAARDVIEGKCFEAEAPRQAPPFFDANVKAEFGASAGLRSCRAI
mmetsp:Transcript_70923/g.148362  ORF Transcript_70923/g.148362 Transcript_70923/m.148362 type:complete len:109 (-) Transcript_70923:24-350(-)